MANWRTRKSSHPLSPMRHYGTAPDDTMFLAGVEWDPGSEWRVMLGARAHKALSSLSSKAFEATRYSLVCALDRCGSLETLMLYA
jgi:hypothetical protein